MAVPTERIVFCKNIPLSGEGVFSANIKRGKPFAIRIRPASKKGYSSGALSETDKDKLGYVEVEIDLEGAKIKSRRPHENACGDSAHVSTAAATFGAGLEPDKKVSYWFSFNRNDR